MIQNEFTPPKRILALPTWVKIASFLSYKPLKSQKVSGTPCRLFCSSKIKNPQLLIATFIKMRLLLKLLEVSAGGRIVLLFVWWYSLCWGAIWNDVSKIDDSSINCPWCRKLAKSAFILSLPFIKFYSSTRCSVSSWK